ncbi:Elongator complex protein 1 [Aphelenchoides besseyi]|nr:Elongator complex protein 1 [Aphelenchoides besseyi]
MRNVCIYNAEQPFNESVKKSIAGAERFCVDYTTGQIYFLHENQITSIDQKGEKESERGCIVSEIYGGAWSPDMQILVVATDELLIAISAEFDTIAEVELLPTHAGKEELQTIGWGSKETQFQGQAGKGNREKVDWNRVPTQLNEWDEADYHTLVQWRADGQLLATSTVEKIERRTTGDSDGQREVVGRRIRVWDRELQLLSCCDILAGIEPTLALRPGKNLILTSRLFASTSGEEVRSLWFFEQNGQYRYNATMPTGREGITQNMQWNADGSILMVVFWFEETKKGQIQFWTVSNAEWALKTAIDFDNRIVECSFSQEIFSLCYCLTSDGRFWRLEMNRTYCCVDGVVVSVCNDQLRLSDFNQAPIPPPMSHCSVSLKNEKKNEFATSIALNENRSLAVLTSSYNLKTYQFKDKQLMLVDSFSCEHWCNGIVYGLRWTTGAQTVTFVHAVETEQKILMKEKEELRCLYSSKNPIVYHVFDTQTNRLYFVDVFGVCKFYDLANQTTNELFDSKTRNFSSWTLLSNTRNIIIGLSPRHQLIANGKILVENCTSYSTTLNGDFVLITTFGNRLFVLAVEEIETFLANTNNKQSLCRGDGRLVERGALIVGHEPGATGTRCWLQMPRGNLEQIFPRDLLIERLKVLIDSRQYQQVLKEMRRHRVNMNLVFDHDPSTFMNNCSLFVSSFDPKSSLDVELLQLFVTALDEEDCTDGVFASNYSRKKPNKITDDKVDLVCSAVVRELRSQESKMSSEFDGMYTVILTCLVKPKSSSIVDALLDLKKRADDYKENRNEKTYAQFLSNSLRHLCYIVPENELFNAALRTYDLEIVSMIADKQQKDPREYLPIIDDLRSKTPQEYQNFCICLRLRDWIAALRHISKVPERFDECIQHVKRYQLYSEALDIFVGTDKYSIISDIYADYLHSKAKFGMAALFFEKCGNYTKALQSYELDRDHCRYISFYHRLDSKTRNQLRSIYESGLKKLAVQLEQHDQFEAAAEVLEESSLELNSNRICQLLIKGNMWSKAAEFAQKHEKLSVLIDQVRNRISALKAQLTDWESNFDKHQRRLAVVRSDKAKHLSNWIEGQGDVDLGQSETMSEASSIASNMSKLSSMSTASARKRKNVMKKKTVIKEGSQYEDSALLLALKTICSAVDFVQDEMKALLPVLLILDLIAEVRELQSQFDKLLQRCRDGAKSIWPEFLKPHDLPGPLFELYRCEDGVVRMPEQGAMPLRIRLEDEMIAPIFRKNEKMVDHSRSALVSLVLVIVFVAVGQLFKEPLASSRQGTLIAGGLGSLVFVFTLTAVSNMKMSSAGESAKSGLAEVFLALFFGVLNSALIHRVATTICFFFSIGLLLFLTGIAQTRYATGAQSQLHATKKRK